MAGPIAFLVPDPIQSTQFIPGGNTPAAGGLLFVYQVGSTTKSNSYTDPSASTARTNPIVLDSGGNIPGNGEVWITSSAKFVLAPSNDTDPPSSPYWSKDNYPGINNITAAQVQSLSAQSEWVQGSTATFVGVTGFSVVGDQTALYTTGRRVKATVTGGDRFGIVTSAVLSTGSTAVGVTLDSSTLNAGLSVVYYGILSTPNGSVPWAQLTSTGVVFGGAVTTGPLNVSSGALTVGNIISQALTVSSGSAVFSSTSSLTISVSTATPTISTGATSMTLSPNVFVSSTLAVGSGSASSGAINIVAGAGLGLGIWSRAATSEVQLLASESHNFAALGGTGARGSVMLGITSSGPPTILTLQSGFFCILRDTAASTTRFYYNNGGTITSSAAFL